MKQSKTAVKAATVAIHTKETSPGRPREHIRWINCAKLIAMLGVVFDHLKGTIYQNEDIQFITFFSVTAFFFLSGMTSYYSVKYRKAEESTWKWIIRRVARIFLPYMVASAFFLYLRDGAVAWEVFTTILMDFNLEGSFYFVLIYIQLVAVAPVAYWITRRCGMSKLKPVLHIIFVCLMFRVSIFCVEHTFMLETYGGGYYLLGGTFFLVFIAGMVLADYNITLTTIRAGLINLALSILFFGGTVSFMLQNRFEIDMKLTNWVLKVNPPGLTILLYTAAVLYLLFSLFSLLELFPWKPIQYLLRAVQFLSGYTLYIFLYHNVILYSLMPKYPALENLTGALKIIVYLGFMIGIPVIGKIVYDLFMKWLAPVSKV